MNMGFLYGIAPTLDRLYPDADDPEQVEKKKEAYQRHMAFYNCTPQTSAFVLGLASSMEEEYARDPENFDPETIGAVKTSLMGPLSGIGDSFFQGTIRTIAFGLGTSLAASGSMLGPVLAMVISAAFSIPITWYAGKFGYEMGNSFLERLQSGAMEKIMYACGIVGLMAIGGMVATLIGITTPLTFSEGTVVLQDILNGIVPMVLDLGAVMGMYYLIKRNVKTTWMLAICILGGIALSAFGLLA
jgi:PTS system mannose-specific IID component/fructoselysine and glucoselysine-specific PTS system IID component